MESLLRRPSVLGLIGTLVLIAMVSVPVYGAYERGPLQLSFDNVNCTGEPTSVVQIFNNETLDHGLGACINVSETTSIRYTCENGEVMVTQYLASGDCTGFGFFFGMKTNLCFPGVSATKRDGESTNPLAKFDFPSSVKRLPGDVSTVAVCSAGESWTLVANTPLDVTVPEIQTNYPRECYSAGNCTAGTVYSTSYNSTDRPEPSCDQPIESLEVASGAIVGECYKEAEEEYNVRVDCNGESVYFEHLPYGCDGPVMQRNGQVLPFPPNTCGRLVDTDFQYYCPRVVPSAPSTPTATTPSSASLQSPHLFFFFLSMALIAAVSLF